MMKILILCNLFLCCTSYAETIVFIRHAEKPFIEIGQLNCQGLNRALKLPKVLISKFGKPDFIFAPNPSQEIERFGKHYSYTRPLITIEPTAISLNLPVNAQFGFKQVNEIGTELLNEKYGRNLIFVAWEHLKLVDITQFIYTKLGGNAKDIPEWKHSNYDSIYVLKIDDHKTVSFTQDHENLDGQSDVCPI